GHCVNVDTSQECRDKGYEATLHLLCPKKIVSPLVMKVLVVPSDLMPTLFYTHYFRGATVGRGLFTVDTYTAGHVRWFAHDREGFFGAFASTFVKLAGFGVLTGEEGEIRKRCDVVNH
uniref:Plant heme peroxidase family profile domain-containing protein n=1 Tax=Setaria italica TaxID=4555 RepID=K3ZEI6_SETIT